MNSTWDTIIIGAGILGLTIAREYKAINPRAKLLVLDKESKLGLHASGRNSGVLHSGIYYPKKTLKAQICASGAKHMADYCRNNNLPIKRLGKIVLPTKSNDDDQLDLLLNRAHTNGADAEIVDTVQLRELEPEAHSATDRALYVQSTSVIDPLMVLNSLHRELTENGVKFLFSTQFEKIDMTQRKLYASGRVFSFGHVVNASGQYSDRIAKKFGVGKQYTLIPFRGSYYKLSKASDISLNHLVYPVPDLNVPFLGIHSVTTIDGSTYFGPSAIPVFGREHYSGLKGIELEGLINTIKNITQQYIANNQAFRRYTHEEIARLFKSEFVKAASSLIPRLQASMLLNSGKSGIRAQLIDLETKKLVMDFAVEQDQYSTHVLNAVSPAFTSSFSMAKKICSNL